MSLAIRQISTAQSIAAMNQMKKITKREVHDIALGIPKEFKQKKAYMQSDAFLQDAHNQKMFALADRLIELRNKISLNIANFNAKSGDELAQGTNGFTRIKKYLQKDKDMNFSNSYATISAIAPFDAEYGLVKNYMIRNLSKEAKAELGK